MHTYEELARELMEEFDRGGPVPPPDKFNKSIRGEMAVLRLLGRETSMPTAGDICRMTGMKTPRLAAVLKSLEKKAMIERCIDENDKRKVMVRLTQEGAAFCRSKKEEAIAHTTKILEHFGENDAQEYVRLMKKLREILPLVGPPDSNEPCEEEENDE